MVVVGADIFVARMADEHGARHHFAEPAARVITEVSLAHIGNGQNLVALRVGRFRRTGAAPIIDRRNGAAGKNSRCHHDRSLCRLR